jgi:hypothetical protein
MQDVSLNLEVLPSLPTRNERLKKADWQMIYYDAGV